MKRLTRYEFIEKCLEKHGDRYDYSLVEYKNISSKILIICKKHGEFTQNAKNHRDGQGCPNCSGRIIKSKKQYLSSFNVGKYDYSLVYDGILTNNDYLNIIEKNTGLVYVQLLKHHKNGIKPTKIESKSLVRKLKEIHNNKFDYIIEKETYYATDKIKIINKLTTDEFYYRIDRHLNGMTPNKVTLNYFLIKSKELHNNKYDYSLIKEIKGGLSKVDIICKEHGVFKQRVSNHMNSGDGCPKCAGVGKWNTDLLISEFIKVHSDLFDYINVNFQGVDKKVEIICKEHGPFLQNIHKHLKGQGCPECSYSSKGEEYVKMYLEEFGIKYIRQNSFDTCRYINRLSFDFYLPELNTCIEFDGIQHFKPIMEFGGKKEFKIIQERDKCKNDWCIENQVGLIRIRYDQIDKIKSILIEELEKNNIES